MPPPPRRHRPPAPIALIVLLALTVLWTVVVALGGTAPLDRATVAPEIEPSSALGQILAAVAIVTHPIVTFVTLLVCAQWAMRRRLRNLSAACVAAIPVAWGSEVIVKHFLGRARPPSVNEHILTQTGYAYPSGHVTAMTTVAVLVMALVMTTRQRARAVRLARVLTGAALLLVAVDRWALRAHWLSDIIGAALFGATAAALVLAVFRIHYLSTPWHSRQPADTAGGGASAAVVYNPAKVGDLGVFRQRIEYELKARGWSRPLYLETSVEDPGYKAARTAVRKNVDLVLAAGGDGTVREVCSALANSGVPLGLLPAGTTNLLARNLGVPLDEDEAMRTALDGVRSRIDLVRIVPDDDDRRSTHLDVMGGVGLDAATFANTDEDLKASLGHAAYFVAAARQWQGSPNSFEARVTADDQDPEMVTASMITIGNVGSIQGGFEVVRGAQPDDGLLNLAVFTQDSIAQWLQFAGDVIANRESEATLSLTARTVRLEFDDDIEFELDGDAMGTCHVLTATIQEGALTVMLPEQR